MLNMLFRPVYGQEKREVGEEATEGAGRAGAGLPARW
jgi:hypothetical protein